MVQNFGGVFTWATVCLNFIISNISRLTLIFFSTPSPIGKKYQVVEHSQKKIIGAPEQTLLQISNTRTLKRMRVKFQTTNLPHKVKTQYLQI